MGNWIIPFMNFDSESLEIRVKKWWVANDTTLTGAAHPIVIQEDDDEYMFTPVRLESGYIRIYDNGKDVNGNNFYWNNMIPDSAIQIPVELWNVNDDDLLWAGFVQPTSFSGDFDAAPQEREFPVVGLLSILESYDFTLTETNPVSLASILYKLLTIPSVITSYIEYIYFQGIDAIYTDSGSPDLWLNYRVSPALFMETDEDGNPQPKYNCLEVLTQFCQYFGLTARMDGTRLFFVSPAHDIATMGFTRTTLQDIETLMEQSGHITTQSATFITEALTEAMLVDTDNTETFVPGIGKVKVEEDVDKIDGLLKLPKDEIVKYGVKISAAQGEPIYGSTILQERYGGSSTTTGAGCLYYCFVNTALSNPSQGVYFYQYKFKDVDVTIPLYGYESQDPIQYANFVVSDWDDDAYKETSGTWNLVKHTYNWSPVLRIYNNEMWNTRTAITLTGRIPVAVADGVLVLKMDTRVDTIVNGSTRTHKTWPGNGYMRVAIQIGDMYWDAVHSKWVNSLVTFELAVGGDTIDTGGPGSIPNNRVLSGVMPYDTGTVQNIPPYNGFGIPVPIGLGGTVVLTIYSATVNGSVFDVSARKWIDIADFSFEFLRGTDRKDWSDVEKNTWTDDLGTMFKDEKVINNIFTTDRDNAPGNGILFTPSAGYAEQLSFTASGGGFYGAPGDVLVQTIGSFYNKSRRMLQVNVRQSLMSGDAPRQKITYGSRTYYPIAVSKDWWEDEKTIKMIEL